jgi:hypothetical protein
MKEIIWVEGEWANESSNWSSALRYELEVPNSNNNGDCYFWMTVYELRNMF